MSAKMVPNIQILIPLQTLQHLKHLFLIAFLYLAYHLHLSVNSFTSQDRCDEVKKPIRDMIMMGLINSLSLP